jgi:hypothetical protein
MSEDQFTKLEKYLDERFDIMEQRFDFAEQHMREQFDDVRSDLDKLRNTLDGIAQRLDHDDTERTAMSSKLDRHDHWIKQLADHQEVKLEPQA